MTAIVTKGLCWALVVISSLALVVEDTDPETSMDLTIIGWLIVALIALCILIIKYEDHPIEDDDGTH